MPKSSEPTPAEIAARDKIHREGGLKAMRSPIVLDEEPFRPHGCGHRRRWIDFNLECLGDPLRVSLPLTRAFWDGTGFAGSCPSRGRWIRFRTLGMDAIRDDEAAQIPILPEGWAEIAQFA